MGSKDGTQVARHAQQASLPSEPAPLLENKITYPKRCYEEQ